MSSHTLRHFWDWESWSLIVVVLLLTILGIVVLLGGSPTGQTWLRQLVWFLIGGGVAILVVFFNYRSYIRYAYLFYGFILITLLLTELFGKEVYGAKSWLVIPVIPSRMHLHFQPSEFAKLAVILLLTRMLSRKLVMNRGLRDIFWPLVSVAIPALLIFKQPDLGTAMVLGPLALGLFYLAGLPWVYLILFISPLAGFLALASGNGPFLLWVLGFIAITLLMRWKSVLWLDRFVFWSCYIGSYLSMTRLWEFLKPHQRNRFLVFWDPNYDLSGSGYNLFQSKIAIGSGGFLGKGFGQGTQSRLQFLPESHTDFTFAVLAEDWGFLGCLVFFFLFLALIYLCLEIARESRTPEGTLLAGGMAIYFLIHFAINVGMAMGMLPVAGLPLSFLSYGGSHLLACLVGLGLVLNVKIRRFQK